MFLAFAGPTPMLTMLTALAVARAAEVIGRHLEPRPRRVGGHARRRGGIVAAPHLAAAGQHQPLEPALRPRKLGKAEADELFDIALVIRQQDPRLHGTPVGAGVVHQPAQRVIDAHGIEQRERQRRAGRCRPECRRRSRRRPPPDWAWENAAPARRARPGPRTARRRPPARRDRALPARSARPRGWRRTPRRAAQAAAAGSGGRRRAG